MSCGATMTKHLPFEKTVKTKMMGSLEEVAKVSKCKHIWWCHQPYKPDKWENIFYRTCL